MYFPDKKDGAFIVSFISVYHNGSIRAKESGLFWALSRSNSYLLPRV